MTIDACPCDYEPADFYSVTTRRARVPHRCRECGRAIEAGETYERASGRWDGMMRAYTTCARCVALREYVRAHVPCLCWAHGNLIEDCVETAREWGHESTGLWFGTLRRVVEILRRGRCGTGHRTTDR